jgi:hypothetical protein
MIVLDTNVLVVADAVRDDVSPACTEACVDALLEAQHGRYVLDDDDHVLAQYQANVDDQRPYGVAFEFLMHVYDTQRDPARAERVRLTPHAERGWQEFPDDPRLARFDRTDRVFAAVARDRAPVVNATDSDWWDHAEALAANGITVRFLCADRFADRQRPPPRRRGPPETNRAGADPPTAPAL